MVMKHLLICNTMKHEIELMLSIYGSYNFANAHKPSKAPKLHKYSSIVSSKSLTQSDISSLFFTRDAKGQTSLKRVMREKRRNLPSSGPRLPAYSGFKVGDRGILRRSSW